MYTRQCSLKGRTAHRIKVDNLRSPEIKMRKSQEL